jgi:uncharacterized protein (TIGR03083 family)
VVDPEEAWRVIAEQRLSLAELLESLSEAEWEHPSLCDGWRVRDVAAHVALASQPPPVRSMVAQGIRAYGSFDRLNHDAAVRHAARPTERIVAELREHACSRRLPFVTNYRNLLPDILVHGQDIAIPLDRPREMPPEAARTGATHIWTMGWPFWARRHLRGFHLTATDVDWTAGVGIPVQGPIAALLLLITGRPAALPSLTSPDLPTLAERLVR